MTNQKSPVQKILNDPVVCQGVSIRTTNADEMSANQADSTAKIGKLWQTFQNQFKAEINEKTQIFGVYHNYESDEHGAFDVTACIAQQNKDLKPQLNSITIPAGKYLVFCKHGNMPQAVIEAWGEVWQYFSSDDCPYNRKYDIDFEKYIGTNAIEIYIGIQ